MSTVKNEQRKMFHLNEREDAMKHIRYFFSMILFVISLLLCGYYCGTMLFTPSKLEALEDSETVSSDISFTADKGDLYFFDHKGQRLYVYSSHGEFVEAYQIENLGSKLKSLRRYELRKEQK
jgi:hypothetical protein